MYDNRILNLYDDGLGIQTCSRGVDGFMTIPCYRDYCAHESGAVHNCLTGVVLLPAERPVVKDNVVVHRYWFFRIRRSTDELVKNVARHRMVLSAHRGFSPDPKKTHVNHLNGIPGDDRVENLEWSSHSANLQHAYDNGLRSNQVEIESWNLETDEKVRYVSMTDLVTKTGIPRGTMLKRLVKDNGQVYKGFRYRYTRDPWSDTPPETLEVNHATTSKTVLVYDWKIREIKTFSSGYEAARHYGLMPDSMNQMIRKEHLYPKLGCIFRFKEQIDSGVPWPKPSPLQLATLKAQGYPDIFKPWMQVIRTDTGEVIYHESAKGVRAFLFSYRKTNPTINIRHEKVPTNFYI